MDIRLEELIALIESSFLKWTWLLRRDGEGYFANIYETKDTPYSDDDVYFRSRGATPVDALGLAYFKACETRNKLEGVEPCH